MIVWNRPIYGNFGKNDCKNQENAQMLGKILGLALSESVKNFQFKRSYKENMEKIKLNTQIPNPQTSTPQRSKSPQKISSQGIKNNHNFQQNLLQKQRQKNANKSNQKLLCGAPPKQHRAYKNKRIVRKYSKTVSNISNISTKSFENKQGKYFTKQILDWQQNKQQLNFHLHQHDYKLEFAKVPKCGIIGPKQIVRRKLRLERRNVQNWDFLRKNGRREK